jgi:hypothetical protein
LWLVKRDHLHGKYALWWILVAIGFAVLGFIPKVIDSIGTSLGISYPPILIVILGGGFIVIKMVTMDIERSREMVKLQRLAQRLAILEGALAEKNNHNSINPKDS